MPDEEYTNLEENEKQLLSDLAKLMTGPDEALGQADEELTEDQQKAAQNIVNAIDKNKYLKGEDSQALISEKAYNEISNINDKINKNKTANTNDLLNIAKNKVGNNYPLQFLRQLKKAIREQRKDNRIIQAVKCFRDQFLSKDENGFVHTSGYALTPREWFLLNNIDTIDEHYDAIIDCPERNAVYFGANESKRKTFHQFLEELHPNNEDNLAPLVKGICQDQKVLNQTLEFPERGDDKQTGLAYNNSQKSWNQKNQMMLASDIANRLRCIHDSNIKEPERAFYKQQIETLSRMSQNLTKYSSDDLSTIINQYKNNLDKTLQEEEKKDNPQKVIEHLRDNKNIFRHYFLYATGLSGVSDDIDNKIIGKLPKEQNGFKIRDSVQKMHSALKDMESKYNDTINYLEGVISQRKKSLVADNPYSHYQKTQHIRCPLDWDSFNNFIQENFVNHCDENWIYQTSDHGDLTPHLNTDAFDFEFQPNEDKTTTTCNIYRRPETTSTSDDESDDSPKDDEEDTARKPVGTLTISENKDNNAVRIQMHNSNNCEIDTALNLVLDGYKAQNDTDMHPDHCEIDISGVSTNKFEEEIKLSDFKATIPSTGKASEERSVEEEDRTKEEEMIYLNKQEYAYLKACSLGLSPKRYDTKNMNENVFQKGKDMLKQHKDQYPSTSDIPSLTSSK